MLTKTNLLFASFFTVRRYHVRVQRSTSTAYDKHLRESIKTVLTPKSGIHFRLNHSKSYGCSQGYIIIGIYHIDFVFTLFYMQT